MTAQPLSHTDAKRLERLSRAKDKTEEFLGLIERLAVSHSPAVAATALKRCGLLFGLTDVGHVSAPGKDEIVERVRTRYPEVRPWLDHALEQAEVLEGLVDEFLRQLSAAAGWKLPSEKRLGAYLIALDSAITSGLGQLDPKGIGRTTGDLPVSLPGHILSAAAGEIEQGWGFQQFLDGMMQSAGSFVRHLRKAHTGAVDLAYEYSAADVLAGTTLVDLAMVWEIIVALCNRWRYWDEEIQIVGEKDVSFVVGDEASLISSIISNTRMDHLRAEWIFRVTGQRANSIPREWRDLLSGRSLVESEDELGTLFLASLFQLFDLELHLDRVSVGDWLRAYRTLRGIGRAKLRSRDLTKLSLSEWMIASSTVSLETALEEGGVSRASTPRILKALTLTDSSRDLLDCPVVTSNDAAVVLPSYAALIDPAQSLLSNLCSRNVDVGSRGSGFERAIQENLNRRGVNCRRLKRRVGEDDYECDVAFVLGRDLFFMEAKAHVQPSDAKQHFEWQSKLWDAARQLNRAAEFFASDLDYLNKQLNLSMQFKPRSIYKIIIGVPMVGSATMVNGCYVVDESAWTRFVQRMPPGVEATSGERYLASDFRFEGSITPHKVLSFLEDPPQIASIRRGVGHRRMALNIGSYLIHWEAYACEGSPVLSAQATRA